MTKDEMELIIRRVSKKFSEDYNVTVSDLAVDEMLKPAVPHLDDVTESLKAAKISMPFLENSIETILRNAYDIVRESKENYIGYTAIQASMKKDCPYLFWC